MWRSLLAVILLPSLTAAQAPPEVKPELSNDTSQATLEGDAPLTSTSEPLYQSYTRHDAIRRGREEDIGILLKTAGFVTAAKSPVSGVLPLKQEFEPLQGITVREVHGPKVQESFFTFQSERVMATGSPYVSFKIRADRNAPLGQQPVVVTVGSASSPPAMLTVTN